MSAHLIDFPISRLIERNAGNGAREALIEIGEDLPNTDAESARMWADWLLAELWARGFKAVPLE